ncbi:porin [Sphingomonas sp. DBB INV C78]
MAAAETAEPPVRLGGSYVADALSNTSGGIERGTAYMGKLELTVEADGAVIGLDGAQFYASAEQVHGRQLSAELVGDGQTVSNIEAVPALRLFEAWVDAPLGDHASAKLGMIDLNSEFDVQNVGGIFLNSSHGIGPEYAQSGLNGPSIFPTTALGLVTRVGAGEWSARFAVFDAEAGDPDHPKRTVIRFPPKHGVLLAAEVERALGEASAVKIGGWAYSSHFDAIDEVDAAGDPVRKRGSRGLYATIEGRLAGSAERGAFDGWLRVGIAEDEVNPIGSYFGGGVNYGTDASRFGFAISHARLGDPAIRAGIDAGDDPKRAETALELTWARRVAPWLTLQPDLQYVINPGWRADLGDAFVAGVRFIFELP